MKKTLDHPKTCPIKKAKDHSIPDDLMQQGYLIVLDGEWLLLGRKYNLLTAMSRSVGKPCTIRYNW